MTKARRQRIRERIANKRESFEDSATWGHEEILDLLDALDAAEAENQTFRGLIREALQPGVFGIQDRSSLPIDREIDALGERVGYGNLMDNASRAWARKCKQEGVPGGEHTVAACAAVRKNWCKRAKDAVNP